MKTKQYLIGLLLLAGVALGTLPADDRQIFSGSTIPYILFYIDNSGSMDTRDYVVTTAQYNSYRTYTTTTGRVYTFPATWSSYYNRYSATRMNALKRVTIELIDSFRKDVRMGLANFFHANNSYDGDSREWGGARIVNVIDDFSTDNDKLNTITDYVYNLGTPGWTPLAEGLDTIYGYFAGKIKNGDGNTYTDVDVSLPRAPAGYVQPPQSSCQKSFVILITDGEPTADNWATGYSKPYTGMTTNRTLPNIAKYLFEHPVPDKDTGIIPLAGISTYTVGMRMGSTGETLLRTTADNTHGRGRYYPGNDFDELRSNLLEAVADVLDRAFAFTAYTSPKKIASVTGEVNVSFSAFFKNQVASVPIWDGHLKCLEIVPDGDTYKFVEKWDAATQIKSQFGASVDSRVLTTQITDTNSHNFTTLSFSSTSSSSMYKALGVADATSATTVINFIRGVRPTIPSEQVFLLGDIFHSDICYVGKPLPWKSLYNPPECNPTNPANDTDCYQKFFQTYQSRRKVIYVGTNDGIVHTIKADLNKTDGGGQELSGFVPDEVLPRLRRIALTSQYTYTTDGRMSVNDIYTGSTDGWRTILAFGLREGGKAVYCRDVTDPENQSTRWKFPAYKASGVIQSISGMQLTLGGGGSGTFEAGQYLVNENRNTQAVIASVSGSTLTLSSITGAFAVGDKVLAQPWYTKYIGYTWGKPAITRLRYKKGAGVLTEKWVIIFTGGFSDGSTLEGKSLFVVDAWTGELIWMLGYNASDNITDEQYLKNDTKLNYPIPQSMTVIDRDNDTFSETIYFGNLGGYMFKLDLSDPQTSTWIPKTVYSPSTAGTQPIYMAPSVSFDMCYKMWLHFGTGNRNQPQNSNRGQFIAIRDEGLPTGGCTPSNLEDLSADWSANTLGETSLTGSKNGWYFDFIDDKEFLFDPEPFVVTEYSSPIVYFNTYTPAAVASGADPCANPGNMRLYKLNLSGCAFNTNPYGGYTIGGGKISGTRTEARISGGGLYKGTQYLVYIGTAQTGSIEIKEFDDLNMRYPGGVFYLKEKKR